MLEDQLAFINKQIHKLENKVDKKFDAAKEATLDSLYSMKKSVEMKLQRFEMERSLSSQFKRHTQTHRFRLEQRIDQFGKTYMERLKVVEDKVYDAYEAASSKSVKRDFKKSEDKTIRNYWDTKELASTCKPKGWF